MQNNLLLEEENLILSELLKQNPLWVIYDQIFIMAIDWEMGYRIYMNSWWWYFINVSVLHISMC